MSNIFRNKRAELKLMLVKSIYDFLTLHKKLLSGQHYTIKIFQFVLAAGGLYQICKYFLANLQIAKLHFANLHFTHPSFYQTFFVQTYNLPNTFCQTYIF